jgi:hypothetical protein
MSSTKGTLRGAFFVRLGITSLRSVNPEGRLVTQAAKGTAAEGGGLFLRSSRPRKASFPCRSERKKGTQLGAFLACSP